MATSKKQAKKPAPKPKSGATAKSAAKSAPVKATKKPAPKPGKTAPSKTVPAKTVPAKTSKSTKAAPAKKQAPAKSTKAPPAKAKTVPAKTVPAKTPPTSKKAAPVKTVPKPAKAAPAKAAPTKAATKAAEAKPGAKPVKDAPTKATTKGAAAPKAEAKATAPATPDVAPLRAGVPPPRIRTLSKEKPIPRLTKSPYDAKFLAEQRAMLLEERARYSKSATKYRVEADSLVNDREPGDVQFDEESGEGDSLAVERDFDLALSAQAQDKVAEIDAALARIADSTYGICVTSGQAIPKERLRAIPWATERIEYKVGGLGRRH